MFQTHSRPVAALAVIALLAAPFLIASDAEASNPYIAQITMFGSNFAPSGWALCNGQILSIAQNTALFSLLGTTFGGDGEVTFQLPDLRGRVAIHPGSGPGLSNYSLGQRGGSERVTLSVSEIPSHGHVTVLKAADSNGNQTGPEGHVLANDPREDQYSDGAPNVDMSASAISSGNTGGGQSHENRPPYLCINYIIALVGIFPSQS